MAYRICLLSDNPTKCKDDCFNCNCGGQGATKDMYVSINNVQRVCSIQGNAADTEEGKYIAEVIRNNLETMISVEAPVWRNADLLPPEENTPVLCYAVSTAGEGHFKVIGVLRNEEFWFLQVNDARWSSFPNMQLKVTHWQPLPEDPKEE